jgi:hypothetical protein
VNFDCVCSMFISCFLNFAQSCAIEHIHSKYTLEDLTADDSSVLSAEFHFDETH